MSHSRSPLGNSAYAGFPGRGNARAGRWSKPRRPRAAGTYRGSNGRSRRPEYLCLCGPSAAWPGVSWAEHRQRTGRREPRWIPLCRSATCATVAANPCPDRAAKPSCRCQGYGVLPWVQPRKCPSASSASPKTHAIKARSSVASVALPRRAAAVDHHGGVVDDARVARLEL